LYLLAGCVPNTALGAALTFAQFPLYATYNQPLDPLYEQGVLTLIRTTWGVMPLQDQQVAGLLMWIPGGLVYLIGIAFAFSAWYTVSTEHQPPVDEISRASDAALTGPAQD
jgi:putative membrane protein